MATLLTFHFFDECVNNGTYLPSFLLEPIQVDTLKGGETSQLGWADAPAAGCVDEGAL